MKPIRCSVINDNLIIGCTGFIGGTLCNLLLHGQVCAQRQFLFDLGKVSSDVFIHIANKYNIRTAYNFCGYSDVSSSTQHTLEADINLSLYIKRYLSLAPSLQCIVVASTALLCWNSLPLQYNSSNKSPIYYYLEAKSKLEKIFLSGLPFQPCVYCIRFANVFGINDRSVTRLIPYLKAQILKREPINLASSPTSQINLIYDRSVLSAIINYIEALPSRSHVQNLSVCVAASCFDLTLESLMSFIGDQLSCPLPPIVYGKSYVQRPTSCLPESPFMFGQEFLSLGLRDVFGPC